MFLTFANTALLIGLAGAVVPLVLHLLSRTRFQSVDWGAMMFLEGIDGRQHYSARLNQAVLLAMRMAIVGLVALAVAQPVLQHWATEAGGDQALRTAQRGQFFCTVGAGVLLVAMGVLVGMAVSSRRRHGRRASQALLMLAAVGMGVGAAGLGRRAAGWHGRLVTIQTDQPGVARAPTPGVRARVDAAVLLDCSGSMDFEENGHTRFGPAQSAAKQVLAGLRRGDRAALVLLGYPKRESETPPTPDLQSVADRIDAAHTVRDPADVRAGLQQAFDLLEHNEGGAARDFYIIADRQARSWNSFDDAFRTHWNEMVARSGATARLFVVPVGGTDGDNVAVEGVELIDGPAILGQGATLSVDVKNYGTTPRAAVPLSVSVNGKVEYETNVALAPGATAHVVAPIRSGAIPAVGQQLVSADIRTSGYKGDDHADGVIDVIAPIRVLVVSGDDWGTELGQFRNESDFLRLALSPFKTVGKAGADPCSVEVISDEKLGEVSLSQYPVVVLANVERLSEPQARSLEQYVYGGGGLLVAPGSLVRVENYNERLWREGAGILPAELEDATAADGAQATSIVGYESSTPVFGFLHQRPDLMLFPTIGRYFPTTPRSADARALAWYTSGAPFLLESAGGRGRVLLMTTSLDADWSTMPLSSFYLPFVQSAVRYLAAGTMPPHTLVPGEPIRVTVDELVSEPATLEMPDAATRSVEGAQYGPTTEYQFADTRHPGVYRMSVRGAAGVKTFAFVVRASLQESDLTQLSDAQWSRLENDFRLRRIDPADRPIAVVVAGDREGYDLTPWALLAALALGLGEVGLARVWGANAE